MIACAPPSASPSPSSTAIGGFSLTVQDLRRDQVSVTPWGGAPVTTLACGQSATFKPGANGAPPLPWTVSVKGPSGETLFQRALPAGTAPKQVYVTEQGAELVDQGGSHGAPAVNC